MPNPHPESDPFGDVLLGELTAIRRRREVIYRAHRDEGTAREWDHARFAAESGPPPAPRLAMDLASFQQSAAWDEWEKAHHAEYARTARPTAQQWRQWVVEDASLAATVAAFQDLDRVPGSAPTLAQRAWRRLADWGSRWRPWGQARREFVQAFQSITGRKPGLIERNRAMAEAAPGPSPDGAMPVAATAAIAALRATSWGARCADQVAAAAPGASETEQVRLLRSDPDIAHAMAAYRDIHRFTDPTAGTPDPIREALADAALSRFLKTPIGRQWGEAPFRAFRESARPTEAETLAAFLADQELQLAAARRQAQEEHLAGLAFSGGGIRSATFSVGMLQGLATLKLLRWFDVLSTVSGGGYAGSWLTAWIAREGDPLNVERQLGTSRIMQADASRLPLPREQVVEEEPEPLRHLRQYSSFLNPRPGWFSIDTWTVLAIYLRNLTINALLLIPALMLLAIISRWFAWEYAWLQDERVNLTGMNIASSPRLYSQPIEFVTYLLTGQTVVVIRTLVGLGALLIVLGFVGNYRGLGPLRRGAPAAQRPGRGMLHWLVVVPIVLGTIILAGVLPAALDLLREDVELAQKAPHGGLRKLGIFGWIAVQLEGYGRLGRGDVSEADYLALPSVLAIAGVCALLSILQPLYRIVTFGVQHARSLAGGRGEARSEWFGHWRSLLAGLMGGAAGGVCLALALTLLRFAHGQPWLMLAIGPPMLLIVLSVAITALVAVMSDRASELEREWWGSLSARFLWMGTAWAALIATLGFGPALLMSAGAGARAALAAGWVGVTALAGRLGYLVTLKRAGGRAGGVFLMIAPVLFLAGLLSAVSLLVTGMLNGLPSVHNLEWNQAFTRYLERSIQPPPGTTSHQMWWGSFERAAILALLLAVGFSFIKVNLFSLNAFYTNRLARCFLGASRRRSEWEDRWGRRLRTTVAGAPTGVAPPDREADRVTGFDAKDDLPLASLAIGRDVVPASDPGGPRRYWGPHYLVNTALSLIAGEELAWRDRKAASFVLSPLMCGSTVTGYAHSRSTGDNLSLGRAVSISGAAVDPSMSIYQSSGLTALLTVLNVRLGHWLRNPASPTAPGADWTAAEPPAGRLLVNEITGATNAKGTFVRLTDGGHFENLGVYELLRRRVRYIVAVDATENRYATSDNLGILVRLARVDFGIRIQLDTSPLAVTTPDNLSRAHVSIGRIRYDDVDNDQMPGLLIYVRSSLTGDEPPDVQQYANTHPEFPREGTLDQSFDEDQFESYRALGEHVAQAVFETAARELLTSDTIKEAPDGRELFIRAHRRMFASLRNLWSNPPLDQDERAMQATRAWVTLQRDLRSDARLDALSRDLYPELELLPTRPSDRDRAELHALEQMLQTMEDAWLGLGMKGYPDLPMNRGWMNTLRRLASSRTFRKFWPVLRTQYSPEFVRFCEEQLRLRADAPRLRAVTRTDPALRMLGAEFAREWPREVRRTERERLDEAGARYLRERVDRAIPLPAGANGQPPQATAAWLILQGPIEQNPADEPGLDFPLGLLAVTPPIDPSGQVVTDPNADVELFLWIRRAHRSARVGDHALREMMKLVQEHIPPPRPERRVRVRFPDDREINLERDRDLWISFYSTFDFKPAPGTPRTLGGGRILYCTTTWG